MKLGLWPLHGTLDARMVGVAQLVRALGCGPRGRGFESPRSPQIVGRYQFRYRRHEFLIGEHMALSPSVEPRNAPLAQLVEQRTLNPQVLGSIPRGRTKYKGPSITPGPLSFVEVATAPSYECELAVWLLQQLCCPLPSTPKPHTPNVETLVVL